mmetsp:Transcript_3478/g.10188  ORF Transcript_3478/g.10188 Transcript_3478/m.10188 type:complete len:253 (+) Transcript_3478:1611-2369(+)
MLGCPSPPLRSPPHPGAGGVAAQAAAEVRVCAFGPRGAAILLRHQRRAARPSALRRARHLRVAAARRDSAGHEPRDRVCKGAAAVPAAAAWPPEGGSAVRPPAPRVDARLASVERGRLVDRPVVESQLRRDETRRRPARVRRLLRLLPPRGARERPQRRALRPRLRLHPPPPPRRQQHHERVHRHAGADDTEHGPDLVPRRVVPSRAALLVPRRMPPLASGTRLRHKRLRRDDHGVRDRDRDRHDRDEDRRR